MLRWRLPLSVALIAALVGLCWIDHNAAVPGAWLMPVAILLAILATGEMLGLMKAAGLAPIGWTAHAGSLLVVLASWLPVVLWRVPGEVPPGWLEWSSGVGSISWPTLALAAGVLLAFLAEMRRFDKPGRTTANLAAAVLSMVYVGLMLCFVVQLRLGWGVGALASLVIVVKMGDTGAYTVGRLFGRHKLAPRLSPGKTVEGLAGAVVFALLGSWLTFRWLVPWIATTGATAAHLAITPGRDTGWGWLPFGLLVGMAGLLGDLAESLLKRDAGRKDSSTWMPGFGGVLDILDSILLAAPAAYVCWASRLVGG